MSNQNTQSCNKANIPYRHSGQEAKSLHIRRKQQYPLSDPISYSPSRLPNVYFVLDLMAAYGWRINMGFGVDWGI